VRREFRSGSLNHFKSADIASSWAAVGDDLESISYGHGCYFDTLAAALHRRPNIEPTFGDLALFIRNTHDGILMGNERSAKNTHFVFRKLREEC